MLTKFKWIDCTETEDLNEGSDEIPLSYIFPDEKGPVKATWYSGIIRIPKGKVLFEHNIDYLSIYEQETLLIIENGQLVKVETIDNTGKKEELIEEIKKSQRYEQWYKDVEKGLPKGLPREVIDALIEPFLIKMIIEVDILHDEQKQDIALKDWWISH